MVILHHEYLDAETVDQTLGCLIKDAEDIQRLRDGLLEELITKVE